ncbi:Fe-S-containing hydro-lyase [Desulfosoma caldarium]|uniref:Fumarate hydratase subunit beta n=1 Tax=Desulfosoma caldarium TaxID=610254 RepID=A0A3N1VJM4_9BACT|nr:Fe-S-containing hydro-lyase [Desulfosoma caldarium]ROR03005.1 fumarate hydratase subunit beta [Desulfosoma caldarium]
MMPNAILLKTPLSESDVTALRIGDRVLLNGVVYTARDAAHKRLVELLERGEPLPLPLEGQVIYYVGPSPAAPGRPVGAAGPTTSYRMDAYAPVLIGHGLRGMIGKGARNEAVKEALRRSKAVYFAAIGGAGALMARSIVSAEIIAYPELGPEAVRRLEVKNFPVIVANDVHGGDLYEEGVRLYAQDA